MAAEGTALGGRVREGTEAPEGDSRPVEARTAVSPGHIPRPRVGCMDRGSEGMAVRAAAAGTAVPREGEPWSRR